MSTHLPGFQSFWFFFLHHFELAKLATSSVMVKNLPLSVTYPIHDSVFEDLLGVAM